MDATDLKTLLLTYNIYPQKWSHERGNKTLEELKNELEAGETILEIINNQLVRITKIVSIEVKVKLGEQLFTLVEDKQIFFTGAIRKRGLRNISEKIKQEETPNSAAYRALKEEIGLTVEQKLTFIEETQEIKQSTSYPGINSIYKIFNYQITLNLFDLEFIKFSEYQKNQGKITLFTLELE